MKYSKETIQILLTMYKTGSVNKNQLPTFVLRELSQDHYITNSTNYHDTNVYLTDTGKAYVEEIKLNDKRYKEKTRRSWIQFWIPLTISVLALFKEELIYLTQLLINALKK